MNHPSRSFFLSALWSAVLFLAMSLAALAETVDFTAQHGGSTATSAYRIYVPPAIETPRIKGVVFFYGGSGGDWRIRAGDPIWQDAVRSLGFALICADANGYSAIGSNAAQAQTALTNILAAAATATGHAELVNVPIVSTGVSLGGFSSTKWACFNPSRVIGIAAQRGAETSLTSQQMSQASRNVHTLIVPGSFDTNAITKPVLLRAEFNKWRGSSNPTGRAAWAVDWGSYHDPFVKNQSWAMSWSWLAESVALRYPANTVPSTTPGNPILLNTIPLESGWLGHQAFVPPDTTGADYSPFDQIAPYDQYIGDKNVASWLPNETLARVYRAMNSRDSGYWTRTVIPLQRSLAIVGDAAPLAGVPNQIDPPQLAAWEVGTTINFTVDPREFDDVRSIVSLDYFDGSILLATQTAPGLGGTWNLPLPLTTVGIHSLTVVATDSAGNKASAFRPVVVVPVRDRGTAHWRFESNPRRITDQHDNAALVEPGTVTMRPTSTPRPASGPGSAFPDFDHEYGANTQALKFEVSKTQYMAALDKPLLTGGANRQFTFEAFANLASATPGGAWRTLAAHGGANGSNTTDMGWQLSVSSEGSGRGARNLILEFSATGSSSAQDLVDSDLQLQLGVDYYLAVAFNPADTSTAGVTFYLKDLTNNGPLQISRRSHAFTSLWDSSLPLMIGSGNYTAHWDGLVDEVRFTNRLLAPPDLLISHVRTPFQNWLVANGNPINTPAEGDLDGDGVSNLMEFALGLTMGSSGYQGRQAQSIVNDGGSDYLAFTYTRPEPAPAGISYLVESSGDLATWSAAGITEIGDTLGGGFRTLTLRDGVNLNTNPKRFLRLRVSQP